MVGYTTLKDGEQCNSMRSSLGLYGYCLSLGPNTIKLSQVKISTSEVIILGSENSSHTCVFFLTLFNEFITGCIPQVIGTQQVWDVTYCNQPITTFNA